MRMFFLCALATLRRGAFSSLAAFAAVFHLCGVSITLPRTFCPLRFPVTFAVPFSHALPFCVPFAVPFIANVCNVHSMRFLGRFKRVICFVRTFAPFALFRAVV